MEFTYIFYWIGLKTSHHPVIIMAIIICLMGILLSGLMFLDFETEPQKLWVSQTSQTNYHQIFFGKKFGQYFRINQMILRKEGDNTDLWQKEYIDKIFEIQQKITSANIEFLNTKWSIDDLCYKPVSGKGCMITSPTNFWKEDYEKFKEEKDLKIVSKCLQSLGEDTMPCFDKIGTPIQLDAIFGAQGCEGDEIITDCSVCNKTAKALSVTFLLNNDYFTNKAAEKWEKEVLQKEILEFNKREENNKTGLKLYYMLERSVTDELEIENEQNISVVVASYLVMFLYIAIMMGEFPSIILSRILVGLGGIIVVALSTLGAFSIVSMLGIKQSLISAEVVPFLVLAIGVDNMFIITGARDRIAKSENRKERQKPNDVQIALALKEVGPSITTAAFGEFLSFLVGFLTDIPALQSFCLCAAFAVLINYFLQMTVFVCCVALDDLRIESRRYDILPCLSIPIYKDIKHSEGKITLQKFLSEKYYDFILKMPVIIISIIIYLAMTVCSIIALINLPLGLNQQTTVTQNGDLFNYFKTQEKYVDIGSPAYIVLYNIDYNNKKNLELIDEMSDYLAALDSVQPPVYSWYKDFSKFMYQSYYRHCNEHYNELINQPLADQVREFLKIKVDSSCCKIDGLCGEPYVSDISFNDKGEIEASRFRFYHVALTDQEKYVKSVLQTNAVANKFKDKFILMEGKSKEDNFEINGKKVSINAAFPYSLFYVYYDQYLFIRGISLQNLLIGFATIFLAVQFATNILASLVVVFFVLSNVFHLIGMLYLFNFIPDFTIDLNAISAVNIVVALGLSVEFCVHIIIFYIKSPFNDTRQKVKDSLTNVGVSVLIGIITTKFIGVFVLYFAPSKVFQIYYFRMYFLLIVVGFFHGFVLLPLFLTFVNIDRNKKNIRLETIKEDRLIEDSQLDSKRESVQQ